MPRICLLVLLLTPLAAQAGVYRCKDAGGQTIISDKPCAAGAENLEKRYANPTSSAAERADVVDEVARRRDFYISQGYPKDLAAQKALSELMPARSMGELYGEDAEALLTPKPKTGRDNARDFLEMREREKAKQEQQQRDWLRRSNALDQEREQDALDDEARRRRADCEHRKRVEELRNGYSGIRC